MPEILIEILNKTPIIAGECRKIVADNTDYTIRFSFDDDWTEDSKTILFVLSNGYAFAPVETENNLVDVPKIIKNDPMMHLLVGVRQGDVITTRPCTIPVRDSISSKIDDDAVQPDPTMWEDVIARLEKLERSGSGGGGSGGVNFTPGNALELTSDGKLNVLTADKAEEDNTLPITSAAVATTVGNIEILLATI